MKQLIKTLGNIIAISTLMMIAASCTKDELSEEVQKTRPGIKRHISASAEMPGQGSAKAYLNTTNGKVAWQLGDEINVNGTAMHEIMLHNDFAAPQAVFEGTVNAMQSLTSDEEIYWSVYPKTLSELNSNGIPNDFQETSLTFDLPATQNYSTANPTLAGSTYMAGLARMEAGNTDVYFHMKNLGAILCLKLTAANGVANTNTSRIEFSTTNGALAGKFTMDDDTVTVTPTATATKVLTINLSDGTNSYIDIATEALVYVYLPPMAAKDLTITIYNTDDSYTKKTVSSATLVRSRIYTTTINNIAFDDYDIYYSVSDNRKVVFAPGNLWYQATKNGIPGDTVHRVRSGATVNGVFCFAPHQYSMIGKKNENISNTYKWRIDLMGWGTSCYNGKFPYMTSPVATDYAHGENDIIGTNYDWGYYNEINGVINGRDTTFPCGTWCLLSKPEWDYLILRRTDASNKIALATVGDTIGMIILPDIWRLPSGLTFTPGTSNGYNTNLYTIAQWDRLEAAGATFLPSCRIRELNTARDSVTAYIGAPGTHAFNTNGTLGTYWTGTHSESTHAYVMHFKEIWEIETSNVDGSTRYQGRAIRLVKDFVK